MNTPQGGEDTLALAQRLLKAARELEIRHARQAGKLEQEREAARQRFDTDDPRVLRAMLDSTEESLARMEEELREEAESFQRDYGDLL